MPQESIESMAERRKAAIVKSGIIEFSKKSYADASTNEIVRNSGISKGLLFHYFGSKKEFYLHCLEQALCIITANEPLPEGGDFYSILFMAMDEKLRVCRQYPDQMRMINMAAREGSHEVRDGKNAILAHRMAKAKAESAKTMAQAVSVLSLKNAVEEKKITGALLLYVNAIMNKYLEEYLEKPDAFFENAVNIQAEFKTYIDFMLYGIVKESGQ